MNTTSNKASPSTASPANANDSKQILLKDISAKWGRLSEAELGALKNKDELVTLVAAKYSMDTTQALRDVDTVQKGRTL